MNVVLARDPNNEVAWHIADVDGDPVRRATSEEIEESIQSRSGYGKKRKG